MSLITTFSKQMPFSPLAKSYFEAMVLFIITYQYAIYSIDQIDFTKQAISHKRLRGPP
jgi:hypothetical protein